ncbi:hypothetical protein PIB30_101897, partial [Stylosanthes scabra]|nr:hypothetical protein [Stylosanthes scabra]
VIGAQENVVVDDNKVTRNSFALVNTPRHTWRLLPLPIEIHFRKILPQIQEANARDSYRGRKRCGRQQALRIVGRDKSDDAGVEHSSDEGDVENGATTPLAVTLPETEDGRNVGREKEERP